MKLVGIDFGAKLAGTTVCCVLTDSLVRFERCAKGLNADEFVHKLIAEVRPTLVGIDAPLSLPLVYRTVESSSNADYFYREGDRLLGAMSPLFLGGLTARAMRLKALVQSDDCAVVEVYPAALRREIGEHLEGLTKDRCGNDPELFRRLVTRIAQWGDLPPPLDPLSWHDVDSFLALLSTIRYQRGVARMVGLAEEGQIVV